MPKYICCEGVELKLMLPAIEGDVTINPLTSILSNDVKINGNKVYNVIGFNITGATNGAVTEGVGLGVIQGNSIKSKTSNLPVVLDDAESIEITVTGVLGSGTGSFLCKVKVLNAGQDKAKGK